MKKETLEQAYLRALRPLPGLMPNSAFMENSDIYPKRKRTVKKKKEYFAPNKREMKREINKRYYNKKKGVARD